jgi:hypothetical protein
MKLAMIGDPVSPERQVYHARRICFLQFPRCGRCRPYAALLWLARYRIYLICSPDGPSLWDELRPLGAIHL